MEPVAVIYRLPRAAVGVLIGLLIAIPLGGTDDPQPTGLLHADLTCAATLSADLGGVMTVHLINACPAPVLLELDGYTYQPLFLNAALPTKDQIPDLDPAVWGPASGTVVALDPSKIDLSGMPEAPRPPRWPARSGLILLKGEGYARQLTLRPGWIDPAKVPIGVTGLVMGLVPPVGISLPKRIAGAVTPGQEIDFDHMQRVYAPGDRLVPYTRFSKPVPPGPTPSSSASALSLSIEVPSTITAGKDLAVTYLVGNHGDAPVWLQQNRLIPAFATWEVSAGGRPLATIDGSALAGMADLLPARAPALLNPGEYLTWRRVLLASALPLKTGSFYQLRLSLDAPLWTTASATAAAPQLVTVSATTAVRAQ